MARKDQVAFYENELTQWTKDAEKRGHGQKKVQEAVRSDFLRDLREVTMEAYEEIMHEMDLVPKDKLDAMLWQHDLSKSIVVDEGKLWVKPGGVLIMYEEGAIPSPSAYPESDVPYALQEGVVDYLSKKFSDRVYIEDINNAVGMVTVESDLLGIKQVMR